MPKTDNLESYLRSNPKAAEHANSIKETMGALKELRAKGVGGPGYTLSGPYGDKSLESSPSGNRRSIKAGLKMKVYA